MEFCLFLVVVLLAIYHLIYENIIAPTLRVRMRFDLYALRDELRGICAQEKEPGRRAAIETLEGGLNNAIRLLHLSTISGMYTFVDRVKKDQEFQKKIQRRYDPIRADAQLKAIHSKAAQITAAAFVINSGGWFPTFIALFMAVGCWKVTVATLKPILSLKSYEIDEFMPAGVQAQPA